MTIIQINLEGYYAVSAIDNLVGMKRTKIRLNYIYQRIREITGSSPVWTAKLDFLYIQNPQ